MKNIKYLTIVLCSGLAFSSFADETPWPVPEVKESITAPTMFTKEMSNMGEDLYNLNCKSCHGDVGQNNMVPLNPLPKDLTTVANQSDGAIYYKINEGRGAMPTFKTRLSTADKWNVIAYIRSFHEGYVQPEPKKAVVFGGSAVSLSLDFDEENMQFRVTAIGEKDGVKNAAEGVEVALFAKRFFGDLKIAENKSTNKDGLALFDVPKDLPGNKEGVLNVITKVADPDKYGEAMAQADIKAGIPNNNPGLTEVRAMWNVGVKAPWWLLLAYPLAVLGVLATLAYIGLLLKKVYVLGKEDEQAGNK